MAVDTNSGSVLTYLESSIQSAFEVVVFSHHVLLLLHWSSVLGKCSNVAVKGQ